MEMPESKNFLRGNINFVNSNSEVVLILICTLDLSSAE